MNRLTVISLAIALALDGALSQAQESRAPASSLEMMRALSTPVGVNSPSSPKQAFAACDTLSMMRTAKACLVDLPEAYAACVATRAAKRMTMGGQLARFAVIHLLDGIDFIANAHQTADSCVGKNAHLGPCLLSIATTANSGANLACHVPGLAETPWCMRVDLANCIGRGAAWHGCFESVKSLQIACQPHKHAATAPLSCAGILAAKGDHSNDRGSAKTSSPKNANTSSGRHLSPSPPGSGGQRHSPGGHGRGGTSGGRSGGGKPSRR